MVHIALYYGLVLLVVVIALVRGDREIRIAAIVCLCASALSTALINVETQIAVSVALIDLGMLAFFVALALTTHRFWPLWAAGLQLTTLMGHGLRLLQPSLLNIAYAAAMRFWAYPILLILLAAALRSDRYRRLGLDFSA
ncbi:MULTISPECIES: hypothetical protein [Sphingomonas]|uniref:hypothetical protein n=1 Tax=Sphingomonas TaxID=13687 RepID=UPI000DF014C7|nr:MULTISPECIES: hypothetical protein [Sphingomonas]